MTKKRVVPEDSAYFIELAARHVKAFNGHISLYALDTATRLLKKAGSDFAVLGWSQGAVDVQYEQAYAELARRLVMNGRRYGLRRADAMDKLLDYMRLGKVTWADLDTTKGEIVDLIIKGGVK